MNYTNALINSLKEQDIDLKISEIPFNLFLKNTGDILCLCFIEFEDDDCLIVAETNDNGFEELRIIPKENIEYISVFYDFKQVEKTTSDVDKMII